MTSLRTKVTRRGNTPAAKYGPDSRRNIVISIIPGNGADVPDAIELRPERTRTGRRMNVDDLWATLIRMEANQTAMARLRERKAKKAAAKQERAWKRELAKPLA
jgi:hypothetical protein